MTNGRYAAFVFASLKYVFERLSGPRTRADELYDLRRRLAEEAGTKVATHAEIDLALRLSRLRQELADGLGRVEACAHCVRPRSASWPGGHCCSGHTKSLFSDEELAALKLAGTTPRQLQPPRGPHLGCAFRGNQGCSLKAAHRPCLCHRYVCRELQEELKQRGDAEATAQREELRTAFERFVQLRKARLEDQEHRELVGRFSDVATARERGEERDLEKPAT